MADIGIREGEILGLRASNNGRSCELHGCCGETLAVGDLIRFKKCVVEIDDAISAVKSYCFCAVVCVTQLSHAYL
jgi:hypothetical protein